MDISLDYNRVIPPFTQPGNDQELIGIFSAGSFCHRSHKAFTLQQDEIDKGPIGTNSMPYRKEQGNEKKELFPFIRAHPDARAGVSEFVCFSAGPKQQQLVLQVSLVQPQP